jgi:phosphomannomutase
MLPAYIKRDDIRGLYPQELNRETAEALGYAVCRLLARNCAAPRIAIGYDCRHGNPEILSGFAAGFQSAGGTCVSFGLLSTEHIYYICGTRS